MGAQHANQNFRRMGLAVVCALAAGPSIADEPPTTQSAADAPLLAPSNEILRLWQSDNPEAHIEGFATWHAWRSKLDSPQRRAANRFLTQDKWFDVLAHEVLYDMEGARRRLTAYKLMRRLGGQRVFPYFLWGIDNGKPGRHLEKSILFQALEPMLSQSGYMKTFFRRYGDPSVLTHLPIGGDWFAVNPTIPKLTSRASPPGTPGDRSWIHRNAALPIGFSHRTNGSTCSHTRCSTTWRGRGGD